MEPLEAAKVKKPRRTSSVPGSLTHAAYRRSLPISLVEALCAARGCFEYYVKHMQTGVDTRHKCHLERFSKGTQTVDIAKEQPQEKQMGRGGEGGEQKQEHQSPKQQQQHEKYQPLSPTTVSPELLNMVPLSTNETGGESAECISHVFSQNTTSAPKAATIACIPYSPEVTPLAMRRLKHVRGQCSEKITSFLLQLRETLAAVVPDTSASPAPSVTRSRAGTGVAPTAVASSTLGHQHAVRPLEALTELWEDRRDAPITVVSTFGRKRGLFGEAERKELHQLVISILNRVTNDAEKYREVKNELLRLPIPEANDAMIAKIVDVFFMKAVKEQQFSNLYADLVSALCKVPEGQRIVGDKAQSLEFRMRQQLLYRCQVEFRQLEVKNIERAERGGEDRASESAEESFKERRNRVCGIVQFVGELFLRQIVSEKVIGEIIITASTGLHGPEGLRVPPPYTPSEAQMDEVITLLGVIDSVFFCTPIGSSMLVGFANVMQHWSLRHPVPRIRFLLLSVVERLQKIVEDHIGTHTPLQQQQQQQQQQPVEEQPPQQSTSETKRLMSMGITVQPLSPLSEESSLTFTTGRHGAAPSSEISPKLKPPLFVGGRPIPAPRSAASRHNSVVLNNSLNSNMSSSGTLVRQTATTDSVARYMQNVSRTGRIPEEVAEEIINSFTSIIAVVEVWTERCLTVVKASKDRTLYGSFLSSINRHHKGMLKVDLRKTSMNVFANAVRQKLHEDLGIFKYWVEMIWSDTEREVLDEDLLNEALYYMLGNDTAAVRAYLRDVSKQVQLSSFPHRSPSDESTNFVRYRPLHVVHRYNKHNERGYELRTVNFADVRLTNIEINVFCALLTGEPVKEALFDTVRSCPLRRFPLVAAEVLSAILHAELCSNTTAFLEENLDLLNLVSDGPERETREILVVAELYSTLKNAPAESTRSLSAASRVMAKFEGRIISEETRQRAQKYFESRDEFAHHYIGAHPPAVRVRPTNNSSSNSNNSSTTIRRPTHLRR